MLRNYARATVRATQERCKLLIQIRCTSDVAGNASNRLPDDEYRRKRKTEWKRRQKGQAFLDHLIINVRGGKGGDGCVAFHREKFKPYGPPSGGNGGKGGDVYIQACPELTTLSSVKKRIRGEAGGQGKGTWMHGKNGAPTIIKVPVGTIIKEVDATDPWEVTGSDGEETGSFEDGEESAGDLAELAKEKRKKRWIHYPGAEDDNLGREAFKEAEKMVYRMEREQRMLEREERSGLIYLDLESQSGSSSPTSPSDADPTTSFPSATRIPPYDPSLGYLLVRGGTNGLGNPNFLSQLPQLHARSPKFATRGLPGQFSVFHLELKLLADVGLVGFPNAGKSTLLRALTRGRSKTEVAGYAFTTVNPVVGVVRMGVDDKLLGGNLKEDGQLVVEETRDEENAWRARMENGEFANVVSLKDEGEPEPELFRFSVADNPGLIHESSQNRGLGHSFLRSIERALALAYVVDFSGPDPEGELTTLRQELETYKSGLSHKARVVVLNKADLLGAGGDAAGVQEAKEKLKRITEFVESKMAINTERDGVEAQRVLDIVPISAKYSQNVFRLARLMKGYVEVERAASCQD